MFSFRAPRSLKRRVLVYAAAQQSKRTVASVCCEALIQYLDRKERREAKKGEAA